MNAKIRMFVIQMHNASILLVHSNVVVYLDTLEMDLTVQVIEIF